MLKLLETFSIDKIIIFTVLFAFAIKEIITFIDWIKERIKKPYLEENKEEDDKKEIEQKIIELEEVTSYLKENLGKIASAIENLSNKINTLVISDRDDIKSYITEKHHYFCYVQKWIDDYSLDCLEKRYEAYKLEGGNSFIDDLMFDIRQLPKISKK